MNENQKLVMLGIADHLQYNVADDQFNMTKWQNTCGTVGCAIGNSMHLLPGLVLRSEDGSGGCAAAMPYRAHPECWGFQAVADELGIVRNDALWLFSPNAYEERTREVVYTRIRAFAKGEIVPWGEDCHQ